MHRPANLPPGPRHAPVFFAGVALAIIMVTALLGALGAWRGDPVLSTPEDELVATAQPLPAIVEPPPLKVLVRTARLGRNQTVGEALATLGVETAQANAVVGALRGMFPFRRAKPGDQLRVERVEGQTGLRRFSYRQGPADEWIVEPNGAGSLQARKREVSITREVALVAVDIANSVYDSLHRSGEDPALAVAAADVLAWDVDFYQDVHPGDRLKLLVEKVLAEGKLLRYGEVLAAEYDGSATGMKRLFRYAEPGSSPSYYDENGNSARRGFLKSPLKYAVVTSGFGNRRHPILGYQKQHQGVDYGAPTGTPVWAVGEGTVETAGWNGACGKMVGIKHRNGLTSIYCHLSSIAVRLGSRVQQRQMIGAVGTTGRSTGPHLHFAVRRDGDFLNPLGLKVPRESPVAAKYRADFEAKIAPLRQALVGNSVAML
ncbi:MAG TPA: M23 family metallopeptidase [Anaeromyxobacteraceae bacterium]|nr:M23 family metallopeptidase [Anaeromyxobacteraceae bacterium]